MVKVKKPDAKQQVTLPNGDIRIDYMNGTSEIIRKGEPEVAVLPSDELISKQLQALKDKPKEEILKECIMLYNNSEDEKTKLAILRFQAELTGALMSPIMQAGQIVAVTINMTGSPRQERQVINV